MINPGGKKYYTRIKQRHLAQTFVWEEEICWCVSWENGSAFLWSRERGSAHCSWLPHHGTTSCRAHIYMREDQYKNEEKCILTILPFVPMQHKHWGDSYGPFLRNQIGLVIFALVPDRFEAQHLFIVVYKCFLYVSHLHFIAVCMRSNKQLKIVCV